MFSGFLTNRSGGSGSNNNNHHGEIKRNTASPHSGNSGMTMSSSVTTAAANKNMHSVEEGTSLLESGATAGVSHHSSVYEKQEQDCKSSPARTSSVSGSTAASSSSSTVISATGLLVLALLACQNCGKNLVMRYIMKDQPKFLTSTAVLGSECIKFTCSVLYILLIQKRSFSSIVQFVLRDDVRTTLLITVPASAYNFQTSMEYVALANLNAAAFSVLVQTKLLCTATFSAFILGKQLKYIQVISLVLLTTGVMLCNMKTTSTASTSAADASMNATKGILATLGIALSSGFASVYTEKVIKGSGMVHRKVNMDDYGLAYTQVQLAGMSIVAIGAYAVACDWAIIREHGIFYNFTNGAVVSCVLSATGGLLVASVLKYADSILKGYATALSVIMTGILSMGLFGTQLSTIYFLGVVNVIVAVLLYNGKDMDQYLCSSSNATKK